MQTKPIPTGEQRPANCSAKCGAAQTDYLMLTPPIRVQRHSKKRCRKDGVEPCHDGRSEITR